MSTSLQESEDFTVVSTTTSTTSASSLIRPDRKVIYINLVVLDASSAIDQQLSKKLKGKVFKPLQKLATKAATTVATPERVAGVLSQELPKKMVEKMASKGLAAAAELVFVEGPYVVVQMQILSVSPAAMIEAQAHDKYDDDTGELKRKATLSSNWAARLTQCWHHLLRIIGVHRKHLLQEEYLPNLIQSKMESVMGDVVADKLESKGLEAMSQVLPEMQQARFFFSTLQQVREEMKPKYKVTSAVAQAKSSVQSKAASVKDSAKKTAAKLKPKFPGKKVV